MHTLSGVWTMPHLLVITVVVTSISTACSLGSGDGKKQSAGDSATVGTSDRSRPGAGSVRTTRSVPRLPKKVKDITADEFVDVIKDVKWTGHFVRRQCEGEPDCDEAGTKATWVRHEAAEGANDLAFDTIPENGVVISRMQNMGKFKERMYQLPGGGSKEWYVVLTPAVNVRTAVAQFVSLDFQGNGKAKLDTMRKRLMVTICDSGMHDSTDAGFKECGSGVSGQPTPAPPFALPSSFNRGAWFTCSLGCCTTEGVRGLDSARADSARRDSAGRASTNR
jgi:hypothetical protein